MKNTTLRLMAVLAAFAGLTNSLSIAQNLAAAQQAITYSEWRFDTGANPALPEVPGPAGATASVAPGQFGMGWQPQLSSEFANATGVWDLGQSGAMTLSLGTPGGSPSVQTITVQVWQYLDGGIYPGYAAVSIPGATQTASSNSIAIDGLVGDWMVQQTDWQVTAGAAANAVLITALPSGSLIDNVAVKTVSAVSERPVLTIRHLGGAALEISWPVAAGSGTLEGSADLGDPQGWSEVGIQPQVVGDLYTVPIQAADTMKFFRLRQ